MRTPSIERPHPAGMGGTQKLFRFKNGYGASVIQSPISYGGDKGLYELAVLRYRAGGGVNDFSLTYDTPITDDVVGYLTEAEVDNLLKQVEALDG